MSKKYPRKTIVNMTILCAATGIVSLSSGIFFFFYEKWISAVILLLITLRQAIVFPKWIKLLK